MNLDLDGDELVSLEDFQESQEVELGLGLWMVMNLNHNDELESLDSDETASGW
jgi:hypothetical protein